MASVHSDVKTNRQTRQALQQVDTRIGLLEAIPLPSSSQPQRRMTLLSANRAPFRWHVMPVQTGAFTAAIGEIIRCDPTGGGFTVTLPAITLLDEGREVIVKNVSGSTNTITIDTTDADTIDGGASTTITTARGSLLFVSDGVSDWMTN